MKAIGLRSGSGGAPALPRSRAPALRARLARLRGGAGCSSARARRGKRRHGVRPRPSVRCHQLGSRLAGPCAHRRLRRSRALGPACDGGRTPRPHRRADPRLRADRRFDGREQARAVYRGACSTSSPPPQGRGCTTSTRPFPDFAARPATGRSRRRRGSRSARGRESRSDSTTTPSTSDRWSGSRCGRCSRCRQASRVFPTWTRGPTPQRAISSPPSNLGLISVWHPSFFVLLLRRIEASLDAAARRRAGAGDAAAVRRRLQNGTLGRSALAAPGRRVVLGGCGRARTRSRRCIAMCRTRGFSPRACSRPRASCRFRCSSATARPVSALRPHGQTIDLQRTDRRRNRRPLSRVPRSRTSGRSPAAGARAPAGRCLRAGHLHRRRLLSLQARRCGSLHWVPSPGAPAPLRGPHRSGVGSVRREAQPADGRTGTRRRRASDGRDARLRAARAGSRRPARLPSLRRRRGRGRRCSASAMRSSARSATATATATPARSAS